MQDTLDDHATKIDQHHQALRGMAATSKAAFEAIEEKDADLRQRLMELEAQVVKNENTIATVGQDVVSNDQDLQARLKAMEQQLHATAGVAQAARAAQAAAQSTAPLAGDAVALAELAARLERAETHISKVEGLARDIAVDHDKKGDMLHAQMMAGFNDIKQRMATLGSNSWTPPFATAGVSGPATAPPAFPGAAEGPAPAPSAQSGAFPNFDATQRSAASPQMYSIGDYKKQIFEDKVAIAGNMQYTEDGKRMWLETTRNYLISKAFEMKLFLKWAESAQAATITDEHIACLSSSGACMDHDPMALSRSLWGYLNLSLTGNAKLAFKNVEAGNGCDAWRRVAVPIAPRSEARLHSMHNSIHSPTPSRRLADVMMTIDTWESQLREYYECAGDMIPDKTKIVIAMTMPPQVAPASLRRALRGISDFDTFKHELRGEIKFLEDLGGLPGGGANMLHDERSTSSGGSSDDGGSPPELRSASSPGEATERHSGVSAGTDDAGGEGRLRACHEHPSRFQAAAKFQKQQWQRQQAKGCDTAQGRPRC